MPHKYSGGCDHIHTHSDNEPLDNHTCHCSVCKRVTGQESSHVVFFKHGDVKVDNPDGMKRQPFNDQNPNGPLELCTCATCGSPIMLDDRSEEHTSELQSLMRISYAVFCLKKKKNTYLISTNTHLSVL